VGWLEDCNGVVRIGWYVEERRRGEGTEVSSFQSEDRAALARSRVKWDDAGTKQGEL
jgi:hypothetical protein